MFNGFHDETEKVEVRQQNGTQYVAVDAVVSSSIIDIEDTTIPLEEGDQIIRTLPNGRSEVYTVLDVGYQDEFAGLKAHYQAKVQKQTTVPKSQLSNVTYNINGHNARLNMNSNDYSINTINQVNETNVFEELRRITKEHITDEDKKEQILQVAEEMENEKGNASKFIKVYQKFMQLTKESIDTFGPVISELTKFLG